MRFFLVLIRIAIVFVLTGMKGWAEEIPTPVDGATPSGYRLVGTVEGSAEVTFAVFENPQTKQQKSYRVGDVINGATIVEIKQQHVLLKRGEELITIHITGGSVVEQKSAPPARVEVKREMPEQALARVLSKQIPPYSSAVQKTSVHDGVIEHLSSRLQQYVGNTAFAETAFGKGIRAADLGKDLSASLGLDPDDVIVGISGMGIDSPERLGQIAGILNRAKVFNLTVIHDSNTRSLAYEREAGR